MSRRPASWHRALLLVIALLAAFGLSTASPARAALAGTVTCDSDPRVFSTGYNGNGGKLPLGAVDPSWEWAAGRTPVTIDVARVYGVAPALSDVGAYGPVRVPSNRPTTWVQSPFGNADWVGARPATSDRYLYFRLTFALAPEVDPQDFALSLTGSWDDTLSDIFVNGTSMHDQGTITYGTHGNFQSIHTLPVLKDFWVSGTNELVFVVHNSTAVNTGTQTAGGLLVQATSDPKCTTRVGVTKTGPAAATQGATVTYDVVVTNAGSTGATGVSVADTAATSGQLDFQGWTCTAAGGASCPAASGSGALSVDMPDIPVGGSATFSVTATVLVGDSTPVTNTATVSPSTGSNFVCADDPTTETCTASTTLVAASLPRPATLTLDKLLVNDDGGTTSVDEFVVTADGPTPLSGGDTIPGVGSTVTSSSITAGTYTLSETSAPGYTAGTWSCEVTDDTGQTTTTTGSSVTIPNGSTVTCTITNDDDTAYLTLVKKVVTDDGGNATAADFPLTAAGPTPITGISGTPEVTKVPVDAGTYTLSETTLPGYTASTWSCDGGTLTGTDVTVTLGSDVVCTITNDDAPVDLLLTKDDGGITAEPGMEFNYTISVRNVGSRDVDLNEAVTVTDVLPAELDLLAVPDTCTASDQDVTCDVDPALLQAGGAPVVIELTVAFDPFAPAGTYVNRAFVSTTDDPTDNPVCPVAEGRAVAENNVACESTPLAAQTGLELVKSVWEVSGPDTLVRSDGGVDFGDTVVYLLDLTATGTGGQTNPVITDVVPDGMTVDEGSIGCADAAPCDVAYDPASRTVIWLLPDLRPGDSVTAYFEVSVDPAPTLAAGASYDAVMKNVAAAASDQTPETPSNETTTTAHTGTLPVTGSTLADLTRTGGLVALLGGLMLAFTGRRRTRR